MNATIVVDWPLFSGNPWVQDFVSTRQGHARMVLLVPNPDESDFIFQGDETPSDVPFVNWDAVIRNSGDLENVVFKATALSVLQDASDLEVVVALDTDSDVNEMYRAEGVLITARDL